MSEIKQDWNQAEVRHRKVLSLYISRAENLDETTWSRAVGEGKWSPIEITEHLRLAYETLIREQQNGDGLKPRTGLVVRTLLRTLILPRIFRKGRIPTGAKAPSEIAPTKCIEDKHEALKMLRNASEEFVTALGARRGAPDAGLTHHLFGKIEPVRGLEFLTIHLDHHLRQLPTASNNER